MFCVACVCWFSVCAVLRVLCVMRCLMRGDCWTADVAGCVLCYVCCLMRGVGGLVCDVRCAWCRVC